MACFPPLLERRRSAGLARKKIKREKEYAAARNPNKERDTYRSCFNEIQAMIGDTVFIDFSISTGFCSVLDRMGLELYSYFCSEYPDVLDVDLMEFGSPDVVYRAVREQIEKNRVMERGGMLLATSSELNPTIPKKNYLALLAAAKPD
jgi:hypothetical protein